MFELGKARKKVGLVGMAVKTQLNIVVGLCLDGSQSIASKFFNTRVMQVGGFEFAIFSKRCILI